MADSNMKLFKNSNIDCNLDFDEVKQELLTLFKSPNPMQIYLNTQNIKDKFSDLLSCLTLKIKEGFKIDDAGEKTFLMTIYKQSNYDKVWIDVVEYYLRDSKNFDLLSYLYYVKILNKDKQYLAKALLKLYNKESNGDILKYLQKYNSKISFQRIQSIFDEFKIGEMVFDVNLREDFIEHFIEKIYLKLDKVKRVKFLDNFILKIDKKDLDFGDVSKIILKVISSFINGYKFIELNNTLNNKFFKDVKLLIDDNINNYELIRGDFYVQVSETLSVLPITDRALFWQYIKTMMIEMYYKDVKYIFYDYSSNLFLDKNKYSILKGDLVMKPSISPESEYINSEYNQINDLKEIILELNNNLFSFFLLPIIYYTISEKLSIKKYDLYKIKYLLLFIFSSNYSEYKNIYMFFNQLEIFLNYDNKSRILEKFQVSASIILGVILTLVIAYSYMPIGVFIGILLLSFIKGFEVIYPNIFYRQKWNIGFKFFAILFLSISSYFWFSNFDKVKGDTADLTAQIKVLGTISSKEVIDKGIEYVKVNLLEFKKIK
ncbi:MAG: hypothetical protein PHE25_02735 [Candidatus Gracilibacteria bacterium]|nr:hypothetical protein [Candidatus Gracilibacteria bacterium]